MTIAKILRRALLATGLTGAGQPARAAAPIINAVGAENQYADVIAQIGGTYVHVDAIENNPNTDPHDFEISPRIARQIADADLLVLNGCGYDDWADRILAAAPDRHRAVINAQLLRGLPENLPNPHLWYDPRTMPTVAAAVAAALSRLAPAHAAAFENNLGKFNASLLAWRDARLRLQQSFPNAAAAVTEPVGDDLLQSAGIAIATPFSLQAAIMNGTDPAPQDVTSQEQLLRDHKVQALLYNEQVTSPLTGLFLNLARRNDIPVVALYETMPAGYRYQSWMLAETEALRQAFANRRSTESLPAGAPHG